MYIKKIPITKRSDFSCLQIAAMKEEIPTESETPGHDHTTLETTCLNVCALAMERESGLANQLVSQCIPVLYICLGKHSAEKYLFL